MILMLILSASIITGGIVKQEVEENDNAAALVHEFDKQDLKTLTKASK